MDNPWTTNKYTLIRLLTAFRHEIKTKSIKYEEPYAYVQHTFTNEFMHRSNTIHCDKISLYLSAFRWLTSNIFLLCIYSHFFTVISDKPIRIELSIKNVICCNYLHQKVVDVIYVIYTLAKRSHIKHPD